MWRKTFTPEAVRLIRQLPPEVKRPLRALSDALAKDPYRGKPLSGELEGFWSLRHERYRLIYKIDERQKQLIIAYLGKRSSVYDQFEQLLLLHKRSS